MNDDVLNEAGGEGVGGAGPAARLCHARVQPAGPIQQIMRTTYATGPIQQIYDTYREVWSNGSTPTCWLVASARRVPDREVWSNGSTPTCWLVVSALRAPYREVWPNESAPPPQPELKKFRILFSPFNTAMK